MTKIEYNIEDNIKEDYKLETRPMISTQDYMSEIDDNRKENYKLESYSYGPHKSLGRLAWKKIGPQGDVHKSFKEVNWFRNWYTLY